MVYAIAFVIAVLCAAAAVRAVGTTVKPVRFFATIVLLAAVLTGATWYLWHGPWALVGTAAVFGVAELIRRGSRPGPPGGGDQTPGASMRGNGTAASS